MDKIIRKCESKKKFWNSKKPTEASARLELVQTHGSFGLHNNEVYFTSKLL